MADITKEQLNGLKTKFSINNFLADLPRLLNEAFTTVVNSILGFYDPDSGILKCKKLEATYIDATTIVAQNLRFKGNNGTLYNFDDIASIIGNLEKKVDSIMHITKDQIDSLEMNPFQAWPLYADYYIDAPETPDEGCKVLIPDGIKIYLLDEQTSEGSWYTSPVADGVFYIVRENMHIYNYDKQKGTWRDLGFYGNA